MNCPKDKTAMALATVTIKTEDGTQVGGFEGYLCAKCRKIWSSTEVSDAIDMRLLT